MDKSNIYNCNIIEVPTVKNRVGNISITEGINNLPFDTKRIFYLYDIPSGEERGAHAHKECHQFLVAASGSFDVLVDDGINKKTISLNRPNYGLHVPPGIWAHELNFSSGSICLVLASHKYDEADYIRDYSDYLNTIK